MVKGKRKQLVIVAADKDNTHGDLIDSSNSGVDVYLHEEDNWVIVKKQRITILIPPLPVPGHYKQQNLKIIQKKKSRKTVKSRSKIPTETYSQKCQRDEFKKSVALPSEKAISDVAICTDQLDAAIEKLPNSTFRISSECPNGDVGKSLLPLPSIDHMHEKHFLRTCRSRKAVGVSSISKTIERPGLVHSDRRHKPFHGSICCVDGGASLNRRMRATKLEREINRAGGLNRWLVSLGLGQFVQLFQGKNVNKFNLVNLTMNKLKFMGATAVGPRRKLIHAINCLSQPYYFKTI